MEVFLSSDVKRRMLSFCTTVVLTLFIKDIAATPKSSLKLVNLLYRHGDRSPVRIYPKDIHLNDSSWPDGLGWLTNIGKMQQFELGQYLRHRYDGFLNTSYYNHDEIHIESSAVDRCLMSAYSNLAGLYPPLEAQLWNSDLKWQPIPVQTMPTNLDNKLAQNKACPKYDKLFREALQSPTVKEFEERNKEFLEMVERETGIKNENVGDAWEVTDTLVCEKAHNLTWNDWVYGDGVWEKMLDLEKLGFDLIYDTIEMTRLKGGPLLKEIITNMQEASKSPTFLPKVFMYSAHDTTVASLLSAMHMYNKIPPPYAALVIVELHQIDDKFVVKCFYRNDTTSDSHELVPEDCSYPCTLEEFIKKTNDSVPVNWEEECKVDTDLLAPTQASKSDKFSLTPASWIALIVSIGVLLVFIGALVILLIRVKAENKRDHIVRYSRLSDI